MTGVFADHMLCLLNWCCICWPNESIYWPSGRVCSADTAFADHMLHSLTKQEHLLTRHCVCWPNETMNWPNERVLSLDTAFADQTRMLLTKRQHWLSGHCVLFSYKTVVFVDQILRFLTKWKHLLTRHCNCWSIGLTRALAVHMLCLLTKHKHCWANESVCSPDAVFTDQTRAFADPMLHLLTN